MNKPIIKVENLVKKYNKAEKNAIDGVSFEVYAGELFAFLGPNGAGKTTTISILTTTLSKTSGEVEIAGFNLDKNPSEVRRNIGIIFQRPSLDLNLTAEENIRLHAIMYGIYSFAPFFSFMPKGYQKKVYELADVLGIKGQIFNPVKTFSGGMKRKMEIIRSLMHEPKVLFLDEPTEGLDPLSRRNLWEYLQKIKKENGVTFFLTTHYLEEAEHADKVCIINNGRIINTGTPLEIKRNIIQDYLVMDSKDREKLTKELEKLKLKYTKDSVIKVEMGKKSAQEIIQSIKTPLTVLNIHKPSLEDAYLEIIQEKNLK